MKAYCKKCDYEFEYSPKNMKEMNNIKCPKCNCNISKNDKKGIILTEKDKKVDNILYSILYLLRFTYLVIALIGIIAYYYKNINMLIVCSTICMVLYIIERIIGINYFRFLFVIIVAAIIILMLMIEDIKISIFLGICLGFVSSTIIREIYILILNIILRILSKKN